MADRTTRSRLQDGDRVVCLGDSITADPQGYVTFARDVLRRSRPEDRLTLVNAGVCGNTAGDLRERFESDVLSRQPTWVTISAGPNDAARGVSLAEYAAAVTPMIEAAEGEGAQVALCTPTCFEGGLAGRAVAALNERIAAYAAWLESAAEERDLLLVPMFETFRLALEAAPGDELWLTSDGVHPGPVGRYLMGLTFLAALGVSLPVQSEQGSGSS